MSYLKKATMTRAGQIPETEQLAHVTAAVRMKATFRQAQQFEFHFPQLDTLVQVEELEAGLVVRATRDGFSEERKLRFIYELEAEGFVSERYRDFPGFRCPGAPPVTWVVDSSWLKLPARQADTSRRFMVRLLLTASVMWLVMVGALVVYALRT